MKNNTENEKKEGKGKLIEVVWEQGTEKNIWAEERENRRNKENMAQNVTLHFVLLAAWM
jgi:hypothetical protein